MKEKKQKKVRKEKGIPKGNVLTKRLAMLAGLIYLIFLTSSFWFPGESEYVEASGYFEEYRYGNYGFTIESWEYSEQDEKMEVYLSVEDYGVTAGEFDFSAVERTRGDLEVKTVYDSGGLLVLEIEAAPGWKEISLRIGEEGADSQLKLYTNIDDVEKVSKIGRKSNRDYEKRHMELQIGYNKDLIAEKEEEITSLEEENGNIEARIQELNEGMSAQTEKEQEETATKISQAEAAIQTNNSGIEDLETEIQTIKEKNQLLEEAYEGKGKE